MWPLGYLAVRKASTSSGGGAGSGGLFLLLAAQPQLVGAWVPTSSQSQSAWREQRGEESNKQCGSAPLCWLIHLLVCGHDQPEREQRGDRKL